MPLVGMSTSDPDHQHHEQLAIGLNYALRWHATTADQERLRETACNRLELCPSLASAALSLTASAHFGLQ
jgi:hypothetical protein